MISFSQYTYTVLFFCLIAMGSCSPRKHAGIKKYYTVGDFETVEKYDTHVHINTDQATFVLQAKADNFRLLTINWDDEKDPPPMEEQQKFALQQLKAFPGRIGFASTYSIRKYNNDAWQNETIDYLRKSILQEQ